MIFPPTQQPRLDARPDRNVTMSVTRCIIGTFIIATPSEYGISQWSSLGIYLESWLFLLDKMLMTPRSKPCQPSSRQSIMDGIQIQERLFPIRSPFPFPCLARMRDEGCQYRICGFHVNVLVVQHLQRFPCQKDDRTSWYRVFNAFGVSLYEPLHEPVIFVCCAWLALELTILWNGPDLAYDCLRDLSHCYSGTSHLRAGFYACISKELFWASSSVIEQ
ncbi:hypothetical protein BKA70DRAFT_1312187 [Coprinopsis sp. MPI-PUGE-AT-0042]|nr:hypothetical protein BKA70DRAFT_1312187 [Coprinopsis sp. MPI-PUGE-AT-0042]